MFVLKKLVVICVLTFWAVYCGCTPGAQKQLHDTDYIDFMSKSDELIAEDFYASLPDDLFNDTHNICRNFRAIRNLIPSNTLGMLVNEHYMNDVRFRHAMDYMNTISFQVASSRFANTNAYQQMLVQLKRGGVDIEDLGNLKIIFDCISVEPTKEVTTPEPEKTTPQDPDEYGFELEIPDYQYEDYSWYPSPNRAAQRSLESFTMEILALLPRPGLKNIIAANLAKDTVFGKFYKTVRVPGFQQGFMRSLTSKQMAPINRTFHRHGIELRKLFVSFFRIVNNGPKLF